jgi:hypothetical protein
MGDRVDTGGLEWRSILPPASAGGFWAPSVPPPGGAEGGGWYHPQGREWMGDRDRSRWLGMELHCPPAPVSVFDYVAASPPGAFGAVCFR